MIPCKCTAEEVSFEWSHHRISSTDSKVRTTLQCTCIHVTSIQLTLRMKELTLYKVQLIYVSLGLNAGDWLIYLHFWEIDEFFWTLSACINGTTPFLLCLHMCQFARCPAYPKATCFSDPCKMCHVEFRDEQGNVINCTEGLLYSDYFASIITIDTVTILCRPSDRVR